MAKYALALLLLLFFSFSSPAQELMSERELAIDEFLRYQAAIDERWRLSAWRRRDILELELVRSCD